MRVLSIAIFFFFFFSLKNDAGCSESVILGQGGGGDCVAMFFLLNITFISYVMVDMLHRHFKQKSRVI